MGGVLNKKVLFLASWYPSKENPTLGNFVQKHAELANEVVEVDVLYAVASDTVDETTIVDELINGLRTVIVYYPPVKSKTPFITSVLKKEVYHLALKKGFKHLNKQYDWVHLNAVFPAGIFARWIKKKYGIPYVATVHWTGFLTNHKVYERLPVYIRRVYRNIFKDASRIVPVSEHLGKSLQQLGLIKEFEVINNVVSAEHFYPSKEQVSDNAVMRFLHISTFDDAHKNISGMLYVFGQLKREFLLHLITEGDEGEVWKAIEVHGIPKEKCIVESKLPVEKVGEAMRAADCFVLFSNYETFSVVLAEAWMSGLPAIYSQCGGLTEIDNPQIGIQVQPRDEQAFSNALNFFSSTSYNSKAICEFSKQFSEESIKIKLRLLYQ